MEGFCRGCLNQYNEPTDLLQYTEKNRRLFVYCTGIQVKRNDAFTFQLCKDCYLNMKVGCKFKKQCRNSDKRYRSYLALKDAGEVIDFNTYLKNNDESLTFRLSMPCSGTPNINKVKDEDNESTCTSIQNFIADIMESEEIRIPATEARIIREVIEEEADVLDDSLDSHWLQDDVSIETDFKLDFSFSPFTTPNYINDDHCYTPKKLENDTLPRLSPNFSPKVEIPSQGCQDFAKQNLAIVDDTQQCTIDRNLENALQDETNENFYLHDLLVTPPFYPNVSGPPTPVIKNILFGDKLEGAETNSPTNPNRREENFDTVESEARFLEEFFANTKELKADVGWIESAQTLSVAEQDRNIECSERERDVPTVTVSPDTGKYSVTNFYCKMCRKQFKNLPALKGHCSRRHKFKIKDKVPYARKARICDHCGKQYWNLAEFVTHVHSHNKPQEPQQCKHCTLMFSSESKLKMHMTTHIGKFKANSPKKKYICSECGSGCSSAANLKTHQMRHSKSYTVHCGQCGRGFYRRSDLVTHIRHHTGEKPFPCQHCDRSFARRDVLNRHMKCHTNEKPFECRFCRTRYSKRQELKMHLDKGKACRERRHKLATEAKAAEVKATTNTVSVYYATVSGTDLILPTLQAELSKLGSI
ncbi:unnamed protein product, partial [Iphiclides podalirius]